MLTARPATTMDLAYVLDSFAHEFSRSPSAAGLARAQVRALMVRVLENRDWNCSILHVDTEPDEILCYAVWRSPQEIAWLQTKGLFKRMGMARKLLAIIGTDLSRPIKITFAPAINNHLANLRHQPYVGVI